jgi:uncharacterized protein YqgV (UPF0045/DUF77 family)
VTARGLEVQVGPFGTVAAGALDELIDAASPLLRDAVDAGAVRISLHLNARPKTDLRGTATGLVSLHDALSRMIGAVERELGARLVDLSRENKQAAVRILDDQGAFLLRKAVDDVADAMGVSRITIYNYLNSEKGG